MRPSLLLHLREAGLTEAACLDFDLSVRSVKRMADRRAEQTKQVEDDEPERKHKRRMKTVPKYPTLLEIVGLGADGNDADLPVSAEVAALADAFASGDVDWSTFGWGED